MAEQKESSVLFSLKELMNLEEDRIKKEEDDKKKREEAELAAKLDAERKAREEEERRLRAEDDRRRGEEQRSREEAARLEAIRHGEVEKARVEAEGVARMEAMRRQQEHEKELHHMKSTSGHRTLKIMLGIGAFVFLGVVVGGGIFINGKIKEAEALKQQISSLNGEMDDTKKKMSEAKTDEERQALQAKLDDLQGQLDKANKNPTQQAPKPKNNTFVPPPPVPKKTVCRMLDGTKVASCQPGDSLCNCSQE